MKPLVDILATNETADASGAAHNRITFSTEEGSKNTNLVNTWEKKVNKHDPEEEMGVTEWRF